VLALQQALNVLGFACGATDGIFGAFTERAAREFQSNAGLPSDGIVGPETVRTIMNLRHVWEGKDARPHSGAHIAPARAAEVLARAELAFVGDDETGRRIAKRVVNLAHATTDCARIHLLGEDEVCPADEVVVRLCGAGSEEVIAGRPHIRVESLDLLSTRLLTALPAAREGRHEVVIELGGSGMEDEREEQREAILLLDAVCAAFD
jgi:hypothetical protein